MQLDLFIVLLRCKLLCTTEKNEFYKVYKERVSMQKPLREAKMFFSKISLAIVNLMSTISKQKKKNHYSYIRFKNTREILIAS